MQQLSEPHWTDPAEGSPEHAALITEGRICHVQDYLQWLTYAHLPPALQASSRPFYRAAVALVQEIGYDGPELYSALDLLIKAKDAGVRAGIRASTGRAGSIPRPQAVVVPPYLRDPE